MFTLAIHSQSVGRVIRDSLKLYKHVFFALLPLTFLYLICFITPNILYYIAAHIEHSASATFYFSPWLIIGVQLVFDCIAMIFTASMIDQCFYRAKNSPRTYGNSLSMGFRKFIPLVIASIFYMLLVMAGLVILVIPGIFLAFLLIFYSLLIILEDRGIGSAFEGSYQLVWGHWWRTFAVIIIPIILQIIFAHIIERITGIPVMHFSRFPIHQIHFASLILVSVILLLVSPWMISVLICQYHDLKLRKQFS